MLNESEICQKTLEKAGQEHLLNFFKGLLPDQQKELLLDIAAVDVERLKEVFKQAMSEERDDEWVYIPPSIASWKSITQCDVPRDVPCLLTRLADTSQEVIDGWRREGLRLIAGQKVGCLIMAGGQGTRLGWNGPKGTFPIGGLSRKSLFQIFAERLMRVQHLAMKMFNLPTIPKTSLYIMTSDINHEQTKQFFTANGFFGLQPEDVVFFKQCTLPCFSTEGKILLEAKHKLARNPNGNGGIFGSLRDQKILDHMNSRGLIGIHVVGVDNALAKILDPVFIGYTESANADIGNKCIFKVDAQENVGMMCQRRAKNSKDEKPESCCVVEYAEISSEMRNARSGPDANSPLQFSAGNICNHYFRVSFIEHLLKDNRMERMFVHMAVKKIPHIDTCTGLYVSPDKPNGIKIEYFIFDSFLAASRVVGLEVPRDSDFAPVKNADGEDSPETCREIMSRLYTSWVEAAGGNIYGGEELEERFRKKEVTVPLYLDQ